MPEPALHPMLELISCEHMDDLLARFSAGVETIVPGMSQIFGLISFPGSEVVCQVTGKMPDHIHLGVDDFTHPLAQVIRSGKPAVWLSLNYGARIEHTAFRELILSQGRECGLYALPFGDGHGRICGIWAMLAPSAMIGDLLNVEKFSSLLQVFQLRSKELSKVHIPIGNVTNLRTSEAEPWRVSSERIQHCLKALGLGRPVLITGELSTGKTWLAHYLYRRSPGQTALVSLDCAVLSEEWQGIKLFGEKSVASSLLVKANRGFLLIENIDRLSPRWHGSFQYFLDTNEVLSTDGRDSGSADVTLIFTSSGCDDWKKVHVGFYHRVAGVEIYLSPLRERIQDIKTISESILSEHSLKLPTGFYLSEEVIDILVGYSYPGNIRELENILDNYVFLIKSEGAKVGKTALREKTKERQAGMFFSPSGSQDSGSLKTIITRYEAIVLRERLNKYNFDKERTAASLSISRRSLDMKCKKSGIVR